MKEKIALYLKEGKLRKRELNPSKISSIIKSSEINAQVAKGITLNEKSATVIFREIYESVRQLGEACWLKEGYEPQRAAHELSLEILKSLEVKNKTSLNNLDRFRRIRHDANYYGYLVPLHQANEILDFWNTTAKEILEKLKEVQ
tara:strand:- start:368 stop:802 length:435 start_codon:yes stop_codon:yes gene_type:complete